MANEFNASDIFDMAVKIEQNGAVFYRDAATMMTEKNHKAFFLELAKMEDEHEQTFLVMKQQLSEQDSQMTTFDPDNENVLYLKALADTRVFFDKPLPQEDMTHILNSAIQTEKDSIAFYLGMKELVPDSLGKSKIDHIIKEEMSHIRIIAAKLADFR